MHEGDLSARITEEGLIPIQNDRSVSGPLLSEIPPGDDPLLQNSPISDGSSSSSSPSPMPFALDIPTSQEATRQFEAMVDDMADRIVTCTVCS